MNQSDEIIDVNVDTLLTMLRGFNDDIKAGVEAVTDITIEKPERIILGGMGGSGAFADILKNALEGELDIPIVVIKDYFLPEDVEKGDLLIATTYSGTTEETLNLPSIITAL